MALSNAERQRRYRERLKFKARMWDNSRPPVSVAERDLRRLAKLLGMLGSAHEGERANAAGLLERHRKRLGLTWAQVLGLR